MSRPRARVAAPLAGVALTLLLTACEPEPPRYANVQMAMAPHEMGSEAEPPAPEPESVEDVIVRYFGDAAPQAMKIVKCESNFNPNARSHTNDHGLFQINRVHRNAFPQVTGQPWSAVYDVEANTRYAKHLYDDQGWRPWVCRKAL